MEITEQILLENNFKIWEDVFVYISAYEIYVPYKDNDNLFFHITINDQPNYVNTKYYVHVDNWDASTIGGVDLTTVEQFNTFMELLNIDFKLKA